MKEGDSGIFDKLLKETLEKSWIDNGYRMIPRKTKFCYFVWNLVHPGNRIEKGDGFCIHHKDGIKLNDDRKNLEKVLIPEHTSNHMKGHKIWLGRKHSLETKRKKSKIMEGRYNGENNPNYGKHPSLETREKMSKSKKGKYDGENNPMYGRHHSLESVRKNSEPNKKLGN